VAQSMTVIKICSQKPPTCTITDFGIIRPSWQSTIAYTALLSRLSKDTSTRKTSSLMSSRILVVTALDHSLSGMFFRWTVTRTVAGLGRSGSPSNYKHIWPWSFRLSAMMFRGESSFGMSMIKSLSVSLTAGSTYSDAPYRLVMYRQKWFMDRSILVCR
jgi:hypothetical protein